MVLPASYQSVPLHLAEFIGKHRPFHIEVVRKLLTVKGYIKLTGMLLNRYGIKIRHDTSTHLSRSSMKAPAR